MSLALARRLPVCAPLSACQVEQRHAIDRVAPQFYVGAGSAGVSGAFSAAKPCLPKECKTVTWNLKGAARAQEQRPSLMWTEARAERITTWRPRTYCIETINVCVPRLFPQPQPPPSPATCRKHMKNTDEGAE